MKRSRDIEYVELNKHIFKRLTTAEIKWRHEYREQGSVCW
jgi:hypothetical protein